MPGSCDPFRQNHKRIAAEALLKIYENIDEDNLFLSIGKITNWGTFSEGEFKLKQVHDIEHPEHQLFKNEFNKIWKNQNLFHNLYEFIDNTNKTLI